MSNQPQPTRPVGAESASRSAESGLALPVGDFTGDVECPPWLKELIQACVAGGHIPAGLTFQAATSLARHMRELRLAREQMSALIDERREAYDELVEAYDEQIAQNERIASLTRQHATLSGERDKAIFALYQEMKRAVEDAERNRTDDGLVELYRQEVIDLRAERDSLRMDALRLPALRDHVAALASELADAHTEIATLRMQHTRASDQAAGLIETLDATTDRLFERNQQLNEAEAALAIERSRIELLANVADVTFDHLVEAKEEIARLTAQPGT